MNLSITIPDSLEPGVRWAMRQHNKGVQQRNAALPEGGTPEPELTVAQYVEMVVNSAAESYAKQSETDESDDIAKRFKSAPKAKRDAALAALQ